MSLAIRLVLVVAVAAGAAACDSGGGAGRETGTFDVSTPGGGTPAAGATVAAGKMKPPAPARMFAGTASVAGRLTRYCASSCMEDDAGTPAYLKVPSGAFVLFTLAEIPQRASAEVRLRPGEKPGTVTLNPNTVMLFDHGLGKGTYLVDLIVQWKNREARWRFGLRIT